MKFCQDQQQKKHSKLNKKAIKKIIFCFFVFSILFGWFFGISNFKKVDYFNIRTVFALEEIMDIESGLMYIKVGDKYVLKSSWKGRIERAKDWLKNEAYELAKDELKKNTAVAYKRMLTYFLENLAFETATKLATGDWGQDPLIEHRTFKDVFKETADNAAGYFIEELGREGFGGVKFNLCKPDFAVQYKITLGLERWHKPRAPECTFTVMKENWEQELKDPNFLPRFQNMFNPWENDLGIALTLQTQLGAEVNKKANEAGLEKLLNQGFKPLRDPITGNIKTPASVIGEFAKDTIEKTGGENFVYTGQAVADAIGVFINTLTGKLIEKWLDEGMIDDFPDPKTWDYDDDYESQAGKEGIAGAKDRFRELIEPSFAVRGDYDILGELVSCPDPTKAGPTNCVITENFRQAIINRMTVGNAMEQGYLDANRIFGFTSDGLEPDYYDEGYPYRSMIILRKFRIIPVGWELAAQYIKDFSDKTLNLSDLIACYEDGDDDGYGEYYEDWCKGLVDPSWVLKAPLNYCKREGPGPEIISEQIIGEGEDSEFAISRNDNYCADEQSCIKENDDGSCQLYGYCTGERRVWLFNGNSCEPKYNTCQTFRSRTGKTASYLENTLDYDSCDADNAGCQAYCEDFDFASDSWNCTLATVGDKLYFDKDVGECDEDDEGCHEFIRTKAGVGANLLTNSSFEDDLADSIWTGDGAQVADSYDGQWALQLGAIGIDNKPIDVAPADYSVAGEIFSLSFYAKNCTAGDDFGIEADTAPLNEGGNWQYYQTTYLYPEAFAGNQVHFTINTISCIIDAIKLERGLTATVYSGYRGRGLVYEKLAPDYLGCASAETDPDECDNFVRKCNQGEVGCEMYTSVTDDFSVPAKVIAQDYCAAECVGYDTYIQTGTTFDSLRDEYFIPSTAQTCGAQAAGCDEFTNLDEVERGGEGIEYYIYLRQCIKPSDPGADCAEFYTWEGSDETGYQLRLHTLQEDLAGADGILNDPAVTSNDTTECNAAIYALPATDPGYNSDCREFYNSSGEISYHLYMRTISCNENCHPYRRTKNNIDPAITAAGDCNAAGSGYTDVYDWQFNWDNIEEACYFCKNQGEWSNEHNACLYDAIPGQGVSCSAGQDGCREYSGNRGNNMRIVLNNDFEGSLQGWIGIHGVTAELSSMALAAGGESLYVHGADFAAPTTASTIIAGLVQKNKSYVLSFIARSAGANQFNFIQLVNGVDAPADFIIAPVALGGDWQLYKVNLARLEHDVSGSESLVITADGDFYIDNIRLTEITDRYYLIKNSWVTPDSCYEDILGNYVGPVYNLGCDEYYDRDRLTHYLHNFDQLCEESAVGCEIMTNTHNFTDYNSQTFNAGDPSEVVVPADSFVYAVYDENKKCNSQDKGCQRLGDPYQYGSDVLYSDVYLKNNPDKYNKILCIEDAVGCEEWTTADGSSYFKDPGDMVCEWRQGYQDSWGWWKKKIKRCDGIGSICLTDNDCVMEEICELETADNTCNVSQYKTIGYGGQGNIIKQPANIGNEYWIGLCPASEAGCSEYIDPISKFSTNVIFNSNFSDIDSNGSFGDGWTGNSQEVEIDSWTLYVLRGSGASINNCNDLRELLDDNNNLGGPVSSVSVNGQSVRFYSANDTSCRVAGGAVGRTIELRKAIVDYQLKQDVDKTTCNGIVDFEQGCVLFNERYQDGSAKANLIWDADLTVADGSGVTPQTGAVGQRDANVLLKVTPDRVCNQWLACRSFVKDEDDNNVCFDIGLCDSVDDNGNCNSFILTPKSNLTYQPGLPPEIMANVGNASGYIKVGWKGSSLNSDYYHLAAMEQVGQVTTVPNGGFEFYGSNGYPIGWNAVDVSWDENKFSVINNPISAQVEGVDYPLDGRSFLKFSPSAGNMESEFIDVEPDTEYVLSAYINTINFKNSDVDISNDLVASGIGIWTYNNQGEQVGYSGGSADIIECLHQPDPWGYGCGVYLAAGRDWTKVMVRFKLGADTNKIKLKLFGGWWLNYTAGSSGDWGSWDDGGDCVDVNNICMGNVYYDDIKIRPTIEVYDSPYSAPMDDPAFPDDGKNLNWMANRWVIDYLAPQSCRLYPQDDSLSCDYYEDSGKRQKGWLGYCLEYDRYPGSSDACLMWWPVDKVRGEGIEEGAGYADRFPLYYCLEAQGTLIYPSSYDSQGLCNLFWANQTAHGDLSGGFVFDYIKAVIPGENYEIRNATGRGPKAVILENNTDMLKISGGDDGCHNCFSEAPYSFDLYDSGTNEKVFNWKGNIDITLNIIFTPFPIPHCSRLVQTVTAIGQNKYWSGRVYQGSDYQFSCNDGLASIADVSCAYLFEGDTICDYLSDYPPFGSIVPPGDSWSTIVNPYEWDSKDADGIQPLYYELPDESLSEPYQARMGQLHTTDSAKRLFAQSYGVWEWSGISDIRGAFEWDDKLHILTGEGLLYIANSLSPPFTWDKEGVDFYDVFPDAGADSPQDFANVVGATSNPPFNDIFCTLDKVGLTCCYTAAGWVDSDIFHFGGTQHCPPDFDFTAMYYINGTAELPRPHIYFFNTNGNWYLTTVGEGNAWVNHGSLAAVFPGTNNPPFNAITAGWIINDFSVIYMIAGNNWYAWSAGSWLPENSAELNFARDMLTAWGLGEARYRPVSGQDWGVPDTICPGAERPAYPLDFCAILPKIDNINVNKTVIQNTDFINLTFNSIVDSQQLPLVMYAVNWGDGDKTVVSGVEMRDRTNPDRPHSLYHLYSYWDLKARYASGVGDISCSGSQCSVTPSVKIKDNWGWCNNGVNYDLCPADGYQAFGGQIVVRER